MYGFNMGQPVQPLALPDPVVQAATDHDFDCKAFQFRAAREQLRAPRVVRIGLVQNKIVLPTTAPFAEQAKVRIGLQNLAPLLASMLTCSIHHTLEGHARMHSPGSMRAHM